MFLRGEFWAWLCLPMIFDSLVSLFLSPTELAQPSNHGSLRWRRTAIFLVAKWLSLFFRNRGERTVEEETTTMNEKRICQFFEFLRLLVALFYDVFICRLSATAADRMTNKFFSCHWISIFQEVRALSWRWCIAHCLVAHHLEFFHFLIKNNEPNISLFGGKQRSPFSSFASNFEIQKDRYFSSLFLSCSLTLLGALWRASWLFYASAYLFQHFLSLA